MKKLLPAIMFLLMLPAWGYAQSAQVSSAGLASSKDLSALVRQIGADLDQDGAALVLVRFATYPKPDSTAFFKVLRYFEADKYLVYFWDRATVADCRRWGISEWRRLSLTEKKSHYLSPAIPPDDSTAGQMLISVVPHTDSLAHVATIEALGGRVLTDQPWAAADIWQVELPLNKIERLAAHSFVMFVQPVFDDQPLNQDAVGFTNAAVAHQALSLGGYGLTGAGVTVGVGDNANPRHVDYIDRVVSFNPNVEVNHGCHTTGTVGGAGIKDERFRGFAPESRLISDLFSQIIANAATYRDNFDMVVSSNSYGLILEDCGYAGTYDLYSQYLDEQAHLLPDVLHVFAAANDGELTCSPYPAGYATVTGSYSTAKNVLTVGGIGKTKTMLFNNASRGPVKDGRLKPEIVAVGLELISTGSDQSYYLSGGTSMSCPNVAGAATLLYQHYRALHGNVNPDNALIKAVLMNSAEDLGIPGPDFRYGFGLLNVGHALKILDGQQYFSGQVDQGNTQSFSFSVPAGISLAKVMLYWNDPAGSPGAAAALVNDLDIQVTTPAGGSLLPLVPDPAPTQVLQPAVPHVDQRNNVEQVSISNPQPGSYTVQVSGSAVAQGPQSYYVVYELVEEGVRLKYPLGGEALAAGDSIYIQWEATPALQPFQLAYSTDDGSSWQPIGSELASSRSFLWVIPEDIASAECRVRVQRGVQTVVTDLLTILPRPQTTPFPTAAQCPGSIGFSWAGSNGVASYRIFRKIGPQMQPVGNTTDTFFVLDGLSPDSTYWVAVAAVKSGKAGMRSIAFSMRPDQGDCAMVAQHGDLRLDAVLSPRSGREHTSSALGLQTPFRVRIQNLDDQPASQFQLAYQVNNGTWQTQNVTQPIGAAAFAVIDLPALDMHLAGDYEFRVAVTNTAVNDPQPGNDSVAVLVRQLANDPLDIWQGFDENFESLTGPAVVGDTVMGVGQSLRWDFMPQGMYGRFRSFVNSGITLEGQKSVSLDNQINVGSNLALASQNRFTGTFNLSNYDIQDVEIRCTFDYLVHGSPHSSGGNRVWIRGSDTASWIPFYTYDADSNTIGLIHSSGSLSLNDALNAAGQGFSASTQIAFGQHDTSQIAAINFGNGITLDRFHLYPVFNDLELLGTDSLFSYNCALSQAVPLRIVARNAVNNTVHHIVVGYQLDNSPPVTEMIDSIAGKDTLYYVFQTPMNLSAEGSHMLSVWVYAAADSYRLNDSIVDFPIRNQPIIDQFPYLQDFEEDSGFFYSEGTNNSWDYGTPTAPGIGHAASGSKAWKTNLSGRYHDWEVSYLYSPCFDIGGLEDPYLSFSVATDIEPAGDSVVYDRAFIEYATDGVNWQRLDQNDAFNWYDNPQDRSWTKAGKTYWHVATTPLPQGVGIISFRVVLQTDAGATYEGIAIDDWHIYDRKYPVFLADSFAQRQVQTIPPADTFRFLEKERIGIAVMTGSSPVAKVVAQTYRHEQFMNADQSQYYLPKSFLVQPAEAPDDSVVIRFYIPDEAVRRLRESDACPSCTRAREIYRLGVSQYHSELKAEENNRLDDNKKGAWQYIPYARLQYVPYDKGYYVDLTTNTFSEFWFNDGGPNGDAPIADTLFRFAAAHYGDRLARLTWRAAIDADIDTYEVQRRDSNNQFITLATVASIHNGDFSYTHIDTPALNEAYVDYRILYHHVNGGTFLSPVRRLDWSDQSGSIIVYPNPVYDGQVRVSWFKGSDEPLRWALFAPDGKAAAQGIFAGNPFQDEAVLDLRNTGLSTGLYLLRLTAGDERWTFKIAYVR